MEFKCQLLARLEEFWKVKYVDKTSLDMEYKTELRFTLKMPLNLLIWVVINKKTK